MLPFTREAFFGVFATYHQDVWPAPVLLALLSLATAAGAMRSAAWGAGAAWVLALLWSWMGVVYHFGYFSAINPAAWVFGAFFLVAALQFARAAVEGTLTFDRPRGMEGAIGVALVVYALVGYPLVGFLAGRRFPEMPTFGLPCPTTIFTLGMLVLAKNPRPIALAVVPVLWSLVGSVAALRLGVVEDYGLLVAAVALLAVMARRPTGRPALVG